MFCGFLLLFGLVAFSFETGFLISVESSVSVALYRTPPAGT